MLNKYKEERPEIKIRLTNPDLVLEFAGFALLVLLVVMNLHFLDQLPERIPTHFDINGTPDGFGSKSTVWILPAMGIFIYLLLTIVSFFPKIYNFPVKITFQNAEVQYRLATRFIRILKTLMLALFVFISHQTFQTAIHKRSGLGKAFMPVFLTIIFGSIVFYIVKARNNKNNS